MIRAKNYETVFKFVKVMPRILVASFFLGHGVYYLITRIRSVERGICPIAAVCTVLFYCPDVKP